MLLAGPQPFGAVVRKGTLAAIARCLVPVSSTSSTDGQAELPGSVVQPEGIKDGSRPGRSGSPAGGCRSDSGGEVRRAAEVGCTTGWIDGSHRTAPDEAKRDARLATPPSGPDGWSTAKMRTGADGHAWKSQALDRTDGFVPAVRTAPRGEVPEAFGRRAESPE